jgi:FkbM family methyltransferase
LDALRDVALESPVLLKIDAQGYEAQVLRGAVETCRSRVDDIVLETSFTPLYEGASPLPRHR